MKKTITPKPVKEHVDALVAFIETHGHRFPQAAYVELQPHLKALKNGFVDAGSLIRIVNFAGVYGYAYKADRSPVSKQAVYQMIREGRITEIVIDDVKFVDKQTLNEL